MGKCSAVPAERDEDSAGAADVYLATEYMAQAHETGTSQVGGAKLAKVFYGRI